MIAGLAYWKNFNAQFQTAAQVETFNLDGNTVQGVVETTQLSNDTSTIKGFEVTAIHSFDYLPGFWSGFGGKISYNYADSDFEYEDQYGGDGVGVSINQDTGEVTPSDLLGILPPANLSSGMHRRSITDALAISSNSLVMHSVAFVTPIPVLDLIYVFVTSLRTTSASA
jgi:hypothetical protein